MHVGLEAAAPPDPRLDLDLVGRPANDVEPVGLAEPVRTRPSEARRGREHERAAIVVGERLERVPLDGRALVDMPSEHELRSRRRERPEHRVAVLERELPRGAPGRAGEVVVADDDPQRAGRRVGQDRPRPRRGAPRSSLPP